MATRQVKQISIAVEGMDEGDLELALEEAVRKIKDGYTSGFDCNDTGRYSFNVVAG
jgi:hypothetical protein